MEHSRRDFLKYVMALSTAGSTISPLRAMAAASISQECIVVGSLNKAIFANLTSQKTKEIDLGFQAHTFIRHPNYPSRYIGMEKWGPHAAVVDFHTEKVTPISSDGNNWFYGHGQYIEEKGMFYLARVSIETGKGYYVAYDPETYKPGEEVYVTPGGLHDCHRVADKTLAIATSGIKANEVGDPRKGTRVTKSSLAFVDIAGKGDVVRELTIDDDQQVIGHFQVTKHGKIIALSGPLRQMEVGDMRTASKDNSGYVYISKDGKEPLKLLDWGYQLNRQIKGEILSVALNDDHTRAVVTNPLAGNIILIDLVNDKVIASIDAPFRGIVWDSELKGYVGSERDLVWIDPDFKKMTRLPIISKVGYSNAHSIIVSV